MDKKAFALSAALGRRTRFVDPGRIRRNGILSGSCRKTETAVWLAGDRYKFYFRNFNVEFLCAVSRLEHPDPPVLAEGRAVGPLDGFVPVFRLSVHCMSYTYEFSHTFGISSEDEAERKKSSDLVLGESETDLHRPQPVCK